jgi:hypothetical protein
MNGEQSSMPSREIGTRHEPRRGTAAPFRELPILFSAPMVRAILDGKKTQTRRLFKLPPWLAKDNPRLDDAFPDKAFGVTPCLKVPHGDDLVERVRNPWDFPFPGGVRLWVKETWARRLDEDHLKPSDLKPGYAWYWADPQTCNTGCAGAAGKKRVSIHMPRWASRITLEVIDVRAERLQDISEEDAKAEGVQPFNEAFECISPDQPITGVGRAGDAPYRASFAVLWDEINGDRATWNSNPWIWRVAFPRFTR